MKWIKTFWIYSMSVIYREMISQIILEDPYNHHHHRHKDKKKKKKKDKKKSHDKVGTNKYMAKL